MWILYSSIIFLIIGIDGALTPSDDIIVQCASCEDGKTDVLEGKVGGNLVVNYTIKVENFMSLEVNYVNKNGTRSNIIVTPSGYVNKDQVKDRRFDVPKEATKIGKSLALNITLNNLTMDDNGLKFEYVFRDPRARQFEDSNTVTVNDPTKPKPQPSRKLSGGAIAGIVIGTFLAVGIVVLIVLRVTGKLPPMQQICPK